MNLCSTNNLACVLLFFIIIVRAAGKREETETIFNNLMTDSLSLTNSQTLSSSVRYGERGRIKEDLQHIGGAEEAREIDDGTGI